MEWGSFSASPTELIDFRHDVPSSHLTPRRLYFDFLLPSHFFGSSVVFIDWRIYLVLLLRLQMWISKDTRTFAKQYGASAEHLVEYNVMDMMVGTRRAPGATILGGVLEYLICQSSLSCPADGSCTS